MVPALVLPRSALLTSKKHRSHKDKMRLGGCVGDLVLTVWRGDSYTTRRILAVGMAASPAWLTREFAEHLSIQLFLTWGASSCLPLAA